MSNYYTPWTWSETHSRHYSYHMSADHTILDTLWSGPPGSDANASRSNPVASPYPRAPPQGFQMAPSFGNTGGQDPNSSVQDDRVDSPTASPRSTGRSSNPLNSLPQSNALHYNSAPYASSSSHAAAPLGTNLPTTSRATVNSLPPEVQANIGYLSRRFIQTGTDPSIAETLDARYRRVAVPSQPLFFVPGRVFKMLWIEPAGQANPGRTRNSTHFSTVSFGEQAYSEIRRFVVVRNKGNFSQCIPVQTYRNRGATKPGIVMQDHGIIHTTLQAPNQLQGENLTKYSIRVQPTANETLEVASRINYGKAYAVEHNVKVLDIGMVVNEHRYLIESYFDSAMRGQ
ncbi:hypothetical protein GQ44DRAFT_724818 [Phaeosphaeriaceae sp. PMI808]|nr:hypothetical protein GQ44DRAFT_724818 [Phaeosphaeriaceae sp. PMI808]